jgi:CBS domain-containing protein
MHDARKVSDYMADAPHAVAPEATLRDALQRMRELGVTQLPVTSNGALQGVLLERDLLLARQLGADLDRTLVRTVLPHGPFSVAPGESLASAVRTMASRAAPCAVVMEGSDVRGVLTAADLLRVLAECLEQEQAERARDSMVCSPSDERCLLSRAEESAQRLLSAGPDSDTTDGLHELRSAVRELYRARLERAHAEERELVCSQEARGRNNPLERSYGTHKQQAQLLEAVLMGLDDMAQPVSALALSVSRAVESLRAELESDREAVRLMS